MSSITVGFPHLRKEQRNPMVMMGNMTNSKDTAQQWSADMLWVCVGFEEICHWRKKLGR